MQPDIIKNVFCDKKCEKRIFVLMFVVIFLELIIAQRTAYAHFKVFFCALLMKVTIKVLV